MATYQIILPRENLVESVKRLGYLQCEQDYSIFPSWYLS